jgi:hypothetical protein
MCIISVHKQKYTTGIQESNTQIFLFVFLTYISKAYTVKCRVRCIVKNELVRFGNNRYQLNLRQYFGLA